MQNHTVEKGDLRVTEASLFQELVWRTGRRNLMEDELRHPYVLPQGWGQGPRKFGAFQLMV